MKSSSRSSLLLSAIVVALVAALATVVVGLSGCDQPIITCATAQGSFAVKYTLIEGSGECATLDTGIVGVHSYGIRSGDGVTYAKAPVAMKTEETGNLVDAYGQSVDMTKVYSLGAFLDEHPRGDGFCYVSDPAPAEIALAAVPPMPDGKGGMTEALPAVSLKQEWSKVRFVVSPSFIGTQFSGELAYTKNGCRARYAVRGLFPAVSCAKEVMDPGGMTSMVADPIACSPCADPAAGRASSGISPDVETVCDAKGLLCVPSSEPPSLAAHPMMCKVEY
jgi:hypothetical protein